MKRPLARVGQPNSRLFDRYSLVHAVVGASLGLGGAKPSTALVVSLVWELSEPTLKATKPKIFPKSTRDRATNKIGDMISLVGAYYLLRQK